MKTILPALIIICMAFCPSFARDPDLPPPDYYGERETVGGSKWNSGDTFIAIALPIAVVLTLALPHVFDGEYLGRIASWEALGSSSGSRVIPKQALFPTVVTSSPIPLLNGWVLSFNGHRKSGYPPYKFPTRKRSTMSKLSAETKRKVDAELQTIEDKFPTRSLCGSY